MTYATRQIIIDVTKRHSRWFLVHLLDSCLPLKRKFSTSGDEILLDGYIFNRRDSVMQSKVGSEEDVDFGTFHIHEGGRKGVVVYSQDPARRGGGS